MGGFFLGIDQGTTLTTAVLADDAWRIVAKASRRHTNHYPRPGWVEQDPEEILENCLAVTEEVLRKAGAKKEELLALGLDHQGETCCIWEKATGRPVYPAIVWQDRRTAEEAARLEQQCGSRIRELSGLKPDAYFSATKLRWILEHVPDGINRAQKGELLAGTLNTYLFWRLSGGEIYKTDAGSAGYTMLMDLRTLQWSPELQEFTGLSGIRLPEICDTCCIYGTTDPGHFLGLRIPIAGSAGDSPASIIGGGCMGTGRLKTSYGTGCFMSLQTGGKLVYSESGLFPDCLYQVNGRPLYRLRGACYTAGAAVDWLKEGLGIIRDPAETEALALSVPDSGGVFFVPAFSGLATPFWDPYARGAFLGLTGGTGKAHLVRAVLESIACQVALCYRAMVQDAGQPGESMLADGGITENRFVMQLQADLLGIPVEIPAEKETAAFGSACMAGVSLGALPSLESARTYVRLKQTYLPAMNAAERDEKLARFRNAAERTLGWAKEEQPLP